MVAALAIDIEYDCKAVCEGLALSITLMLKLLVPIAPLGVPVIAPVAVFKVKPGGKVPVCTENVKGLVPVPT
jgi:hypothetical protein